MELFEEIRREYEHGAGTIKGVARKLGIHRRMVREALGSAVPRARKVPEREEAEAGGGDPIHRCDSGGRPQGTPQAKAHGAADL